MRPLPKISKDTPASDLGQPVAIVAHHLPTENRRADPELAAVIDAWDRLPEAIRAGIVAMVKAAADSLSRL